jgi:hypothetical protein
MVTQGFLPMAGGIIEGSRWRKRGWFLTGRNVGQGGRGLRLTALKGFGLLEKESHVPVQWRKCASPPDIIEGNISLSGL